MAYELSTGAISQMHAGDTNLEPALQVLSVKKVSGNANVANSVDRYRLILSDGVHYQQAMLATQQNHLVEAGQIDKNAIVVVKQYAMNEVQGRRIVICLDVDPQGIADDKIGTPGPVEPTGGAAAAAAAPAAASASAAGKPAASKAAPAKRNNASRGGPSGAQAPIYPIEGLSPYQNKWTIKARVTQKSDIRTWTNQKGEGKLFSVTLMDETGEIRATGFNNAVDNLYELLEENKVYFISKARVNIAKKQFNNVNNEYEITFDDHSEVELCTDTDVPQVKYNFVELASLDSVEKDQTCDVLAVVKEVGDVSSITAKASGRSVSKRELTLVDRSSFSVRLTLWGKQAESWNIENEPVVAFKAVKVGDFGGRSLSMVGSSSMLTNPDIAEAHDLRGWYDNQGATTTFTAHSRGGGGAGGGAGAFKPEETRTIQGVRDAQLGMNESSGQADFFNMRATVIFIKSDSLSYPACKSDSCNKKVTEDGSGGWRCEKCDKSHDAPEYRYVASINVADWTGQLWLSLFNAEGVTLVGKTADEMHELNESDGDKYKAILQDRTLMTWEFACRAKSDTYNDQTRVRYTVSRLRPVDWAASGKRLAAQISEYWNLS